MEVIQQGTRKKFTPGEKFYVFLSIAMMKEDVSPEVREKIGNRAKELFEEEKELFISAWMRKSKTKKSREDAEKAFDEIFVKK